MARMSLTAALFRLVKLRAQRDGIAKEQRSVVVTDGPDRQKLLQQLDAARLGDRGGDPAGQRLGRHVAGRADDGEGGLMLVQASVFEVLSGDETKGHGEFGFLKWPAPGDRIAVPSEGGGFEILQVLYLEHHPIQLPTPALDRTDPTISIYAKWVDENC